MQKISFDFDHTLDRKSVQDYVETLMDEYEVWIITSRPSDQDAFERYRGIQNYNADLFIVSDKLGIPRDRIHFTNYQLKSEFIKDKDFILHLDDDHVELKFIMKETSTKAIQVCANGWKHKCNKVLLKNKLK